VFSGIGRKLWQLLRVKNEHGNIHWKKEIFPYQWRIAISWISGYFIFQFFTPILFATEGAVIAGQMGMTLTILQGLVSIANIWFRTKIPLFSVLIAQLKFAELDSIFYKAVKQSIAVLLAGLLAFVAFYGVSGYNDLGIINRFLPFKPAAFMMLAILLQLCVDALSTYLRCHKKEPFLLLSMVTAVVTAIAIVVTIKFFDITIMTFTYSMILLAMVWTGYKIFKRKQAEWHTASTTTVKIISANNNELIKEVANG
jgi:hypothetical protein